MNEDDGTMLAVIGLHEIMVNTPRLLAWGAMLHIPYRTVVRLVVEIADMLPPNTHITPMSDFKEDAIKDAIEYVYDNHPDWVTPDTPADTIEKHGHNVQIVTYEFEEMVIKAAKMMRQILGDTIKECHYVDLRQSRYIVMEVGYGM